MNTTVTTLTCYEADRELDHISDRICALLRMFANNDSVNLYADKLVNITESMRKNSLINVKYGAIS